MPFNVNDEVLIKKYRGNEYEELGRVQTVTKDGRYWVTNMNMPYMGSVSETFDEDELEAVK